MYPIFLPPIFDRPSHTMTTGTVVCHILSGVYLILDSGESAFAYSFTTLRPGSRVLCTREREAFDGKAVLVTIDSVTHYAV